MASPRDRNAPPWDSFRGWSGRTGRALSGMGLGVLAVVALVLGIVGYHAYLVEVPTNHQAVLISKTGLDLEPDMEVAPPPSEGGPRYKGVQARVLTEGRYFYNPFLWDWEIREQVVIPPGKIGVRVALAGDELPPGQILAEPGQKGILREILRPGRYAYNWYAEEIRQYDPVTIPAGFVGVVTNLAGPIAKTPNALLVEAGERGVQKKFLPPGTYYLNPFEYRVSLVDGRSQRYDLSEHDTLEFLSADGFPVVIDGAIEFRLIEEKIPEIYTLYNETLNDDDVSEEIIAKIIQPESRSICRIHGSRLSGSAFFGEERQQFEQKLVETLKANCLKQGVEIVSVTISSIRPPAAIIALNQTREVAKQQMAQFKQEKLQQESEARLKVEKLRAEQKKQLVDAEREIVEKTTLATQQQNTSKIEAQRKLDVAQIELEAAKDQAAKVVAGAQAQADVIRYKNKAEVAGLAARVRAFQGDGQALARNILIEKIAPAFRSIMSNTDGPIMDLFASMSRPGAPPSPAPTQPSLPDEPFASAGATPDPTSDGGDSPREPRR